MDGELEVQYPSKKYLRATQIHDARTFHWEMRLLSRLSLACPTSDEIMLIIPVVPRRRCPLSDGTSVIFRGNGLDDVSHSNRIACSWRKFWQFCFANSETKHRGIRRLARQAILDLDHQARQMQANRLDRATRAVAWMLYGPCIDAESVNRNHQLRIGIFSCQNHVERCPTGRR